MEKDQIHCMEKKIGTTTASTTGLRTTRVTRSMTIDMTVRRQPLSVDMFEVVEKPRRIWRMRWGKKMEEKLPQPSTIPMPAKPTAKAGSTRFQACETKAASSTSRLISTRPRRNTTRFFPHKICLGSTGNRKSVVRLCRSIPRTLLENTSSEKKTKAGAARTVHQLAA